jgi:hypothetical protein
VRFARARFGIYELIDFVVVLICYIVSSQPMLKAFYERLGKRSEPFMALFGRNRFPRRSTLSRFLAALDQPTVESAPHAFSKVSLPHFHRQEGYVYTSYERGEVWKKENESLLPSSKEKRSDEWKAAGNR